MGSNTETFIVLTKWAWRNYFFYLHHDQHQGMDLSNCSVYLWDRLIQTNFGRTMDLVLGVYHFLRSKCCSSRQGKTSKFKLRMIRPFRIKKNIIISLLEWSRFRWIIACNNIKMYLTCTVNSVTLSHLTHISHTFQVEISEVAYSCTVWVSYSGGYELFCL
jgi:hypothetical protein